MNTPVDPYAVPDHLATRFLEVKSMAEAMKAPDPPPKFFVILTRYFLDGAPYGASALTVSPTSTPNLVQTQEGFVCDAFFTPELLSPTTLRGKPVKNGLATVSLEARLEDIIQVLRLE